MSSAMALRPTRKMPRPAPTTRADGWENVYNGLGKAGYDKRLGGQFCLTFVEQEQAEEIWRGDDIAARMVEIIPNEMLREGFEVCVQDDEKEEQTPQAKKDAAGPADPAAPSDDPKEISEAIDSEHRKLETAEHIRQVLYFSRAFGGGAILLGVDDGRPLDQPLAEDRIRSFTWMNTFTPRELLPVEYYSDPTKPRYGEVSVYRLIPMGAPPGSDTSKFPLIHESRLVRFNGNRTSRFATLRNHMPGWDDSIFSRVLSVINDFQAAWQGTALLMVDFSSPVLKLKNLAKMLTAKGGAQGIADRARALEQTRSIARVAIVDADGEDYKRETTPVTGLAELLEKLMLRLAAAAGMPVSLLMGQSPAGLNATGDSDIRWFYDQVSALQERLLRPALMRITRLMFLAKQGPAKGQEPANWDLKFHPLWQLTELEQAQVRYTQAQADALYITNQVATPQEIGRSRFSGDSYSTETHIDTDLRDEMDSPDDEMTRLGAGAAEDKAKEQELKAKAAEKPAIVAKPPPPKG